MESNRLIDLQNALAQMVNALHHVRHKPDSWDNRIKILQDIQKLMPVIIRHFIYFKNVGVK